MEKQTPTQIAQAVQKAVGQLQGMTASSIIVQRLNYLDRELARTHATLQEKLKANDRTSFREEEAIQEMRRQYLGSLDDLLGKK